MSGSPQPNYKLLAQAGARVEYDDGRGVFVPTDLPAARRGRRRRQPATSASLRCRRPILDHRGDKCFVCFCEDQTTKDLKYAIAEGFDSIELSKRYTTVTMGPCQGRLCHTNSIRVYAKTTGHRREHDRHDDGAAAVHAGLDGPARRPAAGAAQAHLAAPPPQGPGRRR